VHGDQPAPRRTAALRLKRRRDVIDKKEQNKISGASAPRLRPNAAAHNHLAPRQSLSHRSPAVAVSRGCDAGTKIKGRKRPAITDTEGHLVGSHVHPADIQDRDGAAVSSPRAGGSTPGCGTCSRTAAAPTTSSATLSPN
jgi:hypothetical protein